MSNSSLGERLEVARKDANLTQDKASQMLHIAQSRLSEIENGDTDKISMFKLIQITATYHIAVFEIAFETPTNKPCSVGGTVVLIDDAIVQNVIYEHILSRAMPDVKIKTFTDSVKADEWLSLHKARLVIADQQMPVLDGEGILTRLAYYEINKNTPLVLMTREIDIKIIKKITQNQHALFFDKYDEGDAHKTTLNFMVSDILKVA